MDYSVLERVRGGLIVSCQALKEEPLYSSYIMSRMAYAAKEGGAVGIRANTVADIVEIKKTVDLPVIGIIKEVYGDCDRIRPDGKTLDEFFAEVRAKYPDQLFMADCSCYEEGLHAAQIGLDLVGTTMNGYTDYTKGAKLPDFDLMKHLVETCGKPVIAEGGIWTPEQLKAALDTGVLAAVVGTAITRPRDITRHFVAAIQ